MMQTHEYACPCIQCQSGQIDTRNTARGGSTRQSWQPSPTVRDAVILPEVGRKLVSAKLGADAAETMADIDRKVRSDIARAERQAERRAKRQQWRTEAAKVRPAVWPEIRRAVREWLNGQIQTRRDALETMAAGALMVAVTHAVLAGLGVV